MIAVDTFACQIYPIIDYTLHKRLFDTVLNNNLSIHTGVSELFQMNTQVCNCYYIQHSAMLVHLYLHC